VTTAAAVAPTPVKTAAAAPLALTGAPLLVELLVGIVALLLGLVITRLSRRRRPAHQA
jgi:H+/gluconate symporter-like permease